MGRRVRVFARSPFLRWEVDKLMGVKLVILMAAAIFPANAMQNPAQPSDDLAAGVRGRKIFVARCAKCHDDDMKKRLSDGSNLFSRLTATKDPRARLGTRLKDSQERDAVTSYFLELQAVSAGK